MKQTQVLQEIRIMRFMEACEGWQHRRLTQKEAASILGVHERTFRRYICRYEKFVKKDVTTNDSPRPSQPLDVPMDKCEGPLNHQGPGGGLKVKKNGRSRTGQFMYFTTGQFYLLTP